MNAAMAETLSRIMKPSESLKTLSFKPVSVYGLLMK